MALMRCMEMDADEAVNERRETFKMMMMSSNLERLAQIEKMFEEGADELMSDEELDAAEGLSVTDIEENLALIREHGFGIFDD